MKQLIFLSLVLSLMVFEMTDTGIARRKKVDKSKVVLKIASEPKSINLTFVSVRLDSRMNDQSQRARYQVRIESALSPREWWGLQRGGTSVTALYVCEYHYEATTNPSE
jgi:hypothetical protein